jgi:hypothetical protein
METKIFKHIDNTIINNLQWKKMIKIVKCHQAYKYTDKVSRPYF